MKVRHLRSMAVISGHMICNARFGTFLLVMFFLIGRFERPLSIFAQSAGFPASWCIFPYVISNHVFLLIYWLGLVYIHADIPFQQHYEMYLVIRLGRIRWTLVHMAGLFIRSFVAAVFCFGISVIIMIPYIQWDNEWGKLMRTLGMTDAGKKYGISFSVYAESIIKNTPVRLAVTTVMILTLVGTFFGLTMYLMAVYAGRFPAIAIGAAQALLMFFPINTFNLNMRPLVARWVPAVWGKIAEANTPMMGLMIWIPDMSYMLRFLGLGFFITGVFILIRVRRMELHWVNED